MDMRKPGWLKTSPGSGGVYADISGILRANRLNTVCESARCPNRGECWGEGTATFMILGDVCTRNCGFCAVKTGGKGLPVDATEGERIALVSRKLGLEYVVLTSVDRDDLPDKGSGHYGDCIRVLKSEALNVEALIPDYVGDDLGRVVAAGPDVLAHNIEVVRRLQGLRDWRASYEKSLNTLRQAREYGVKSTKSSIMVGLGETFDEVECAMDDLLDVGVDILVVGQYLQPTRKQAEVREYVSPETFMEYKKTGLVKGFSCVISFPLARTSYHARKAFEGL
jgi:lipoyl synthase